LSPPIKTAPCDDAQSMISSPPRQTLLIDADDTLWENNIYFERAIASFISYLDHHRHAPAGVRQVLNRCEHATIAEHGYGMASFERSLVDCFTELSEAPPSDEQRQRIATFAHSIADRAIELLPGVAETLPLLASRHRLILVTKGNAREQQNKLDRSGIHMHFAAVEIRPEKHPNAYREIVARYGLVHETTWMIGNSPRSDINPALAAGLHAVYMHHPNTWVLEHDDLAQPMPPQRLLQLDRFAALAEHL
jgi:putative hydrolase of the HAD superfamily